MKPINEITLIRTKSVEVKLNQEFNNLYCGYK